jgi:hypothetical protein
MLMLAWKTLRRIHVAVMLRRAILSAHYNLS